MILLIYDHPYPQQSQVNRTLLKAVKDLPDLQIRSLYDLYPDFYIDVEKEQAALQMADLIIWQHPLYWYHTPALMTLWFEKVLSHGWAYGPEGYAVTGKKLLWVTTTGGDANDYGANEPDSMPLNLLSSSIEQTARFCGMEWSAPFVVHDARLISDDALRRAATDYRLRVKQLAESAELINGGTCHA